ncbi:MAG: flotillin family protein [Myxococcales bacterium]|nr:flotillin family protein [Myxococcales bacterium]
MLSPLLSPLAAGSGLSLLAAAPGELTNVAIAAAATSIAILLALVVVKRFRYVCRPSEALVFAGRSQRSHGGPRVILGRARKGDDNPGSGQGGAWRLPFVERVDRIDMRTHSIDIIVQNAYSTGNIPLRIHAIANVKVHSDPKLIRNAIERFLNQSPDEIRRVAQQTLEGALREVVAKMTPEKVNSDRLTFAKSLSDTADDDLNKLGLQLDTLKIQSVSDDTGYLDSLGRPQIAAALRDAENAENQARQEIAESQALANEVASVAKAEAETAIVRQRNALTQLEAELVGEAAAVEREAEAAAKTARAVAEQELQDIRNALEQKRLLADVVLPAEARKLAAQLKARGDAAPTIEDGEAVAKVLTATATAWQQIGPKARELYVIQHLEELVGVVAKSVGTLDVHEVNVIDPGDGSGLASYAASYPQTVAAVLGALRDTTGVDIPALLAAGEAEDARRSSAGALLGGRSEQR